MDKIGAAKQLREIADFLASPEQVAHQEKEREEALRKIQDWNKRVEGIRDYSYRMVPLRLIGAAEKIIKEGFPSGVTPEISFANSMMELARKYLEL